VIFFDIIDFLKWNLLKLFSMNRNPGDIWFLLRDICKIYSASQRQYIVHPPYLTRSLIYDIPFSTFDFSFIVIQTALT